MNRRRRRVALAGIVSVNLIVGSALNDLATLPALVWWGLVVVWVSLIAAAIDSMFPRTRIYTGGAVAPRCSWCGVLVVAHEGTCEGSRG